MRYYSKSLRLLVLLILLPWLAGAQVRFPVKTSPNNRYLVDQDNKPFPIQGRTSWCVISQPVKDYQVYIENTVSHGFNAIEMAVIHHWPQSNYPPHNGQGDLPFLKRLDGSVWNGSLVYATPNAQAPDLTTPNEAYWTFVDGFLNYCESKGILVFIFPAYLGYPGTKEGWMKELLANGEAKTKAYGNWIATRYKNQRNLVWMLLGDQGSFKPEERAVEAALIQGLKSVPNQQSIQYTAEPGSGQCSADQVDFGDQMTLNGVYSWGHVSIPKLGRHGYSHQPVMPAFLLEEPYDEEGPDGNKFNPHATQPVRRFEWWGWLTTTGGYIAGNGYIWPFIDLWWQNHLNTPATLDLQRLNEFMHAIDWWKLVPSGLNGMKTLVTNGSGTDSTSDYVAAAAAADGTLLVAYLPPDHKGSITVDLSVLKKSVQAFWFDPTNGKIDPVIGAPFNNKSSQSFTTPGNNSNGQQDWVLKLVAKDP